MKRNMIVLFIGSAGAFSDSVLSLLEAQSALTIHRLPLSSFSLSIKKELHPDCIVYCNPVINDRKNDPLDILVSTFWETPVIVVTETIDTSLCIHYFTNGITDIILADDMKRLPGSIENTVRKKQTGKELITNDRDFLFEYERLKLALFGTEQGIWDYNVRSGDLYLSNKYLEIIGEESENFDGAAEFCLHMVVPEDRAAAASTFYRPSEESSLPFQSKYRIYTKNGAIRWIESISRIVKFGKDNQPSRIVGNIKDITHEQEVILQLAEKSAILKNLLDNSPSLVYVVDKEGRFILINKTLERIFGVSSEYLQGKTRDTVLSVETAKKHRSNDLEVLEKKIPVSFEEENVQSDGKHTYLSIKAPLIGADGIAHGICGISIDITSRKKLEETLLQTHAHYRQALNQINAIAYLRYYDSERFEFIDEGIERCIGYTRAQITLPFWKSLIVETIMLGDAVNMSRAQATEKARSGELMQWLCEYRIVAKNGEEKWLSDTAVQIRDENGVSIGSLGVLMDITERKNIELSLKNALYQSNILYEFSSQLNHSFDPYYIGKTIIETLEKTLSWKRGSLWLLDTKSGNMQLIAHSNTGLSDELAGSEFERVKQLVPGDTSGICGVVSRTGILIRTGDVSSIPNYIEADSLIRSELCVPVFIDGKPAGCLNVESELSDAFSEADEHLLVTFANICSTALKNVRLFAEQQKTLESLQESEERFRLLIDNIAEVLLITSLDDKIQFVNRRFTDVFGYEPAEVLGRYGYDVLQIAEHKDLLLYQNELRKAGVKSGYEVTGKTKEGKQIWLYISGAPLPDASGKIIGTVGLLSDITERKQTEKRLLNLSKAIEQNPVSVVITDKAGIVTYVNPKFSELSGYSETEILGKRMSLVKSGYHDMAFYKKMWETILSGNDFKGELLNKKKNGELYWENAVISPIFNDEGEIINFVAIKEDISERKRMIEDLISAKDEALEMNRLKSSFLANMSHELRTPLIGILGYSEILREYDKDEEVRSMTSVIYKSGRRLLETLNIILNLSRIEAGKLELQVSKVNVQELLNEVRELFAENIRQKHLTLMNKTSEEPIYLMTDPGVFRQIAGNLLNNAIKFTPAGSVTITASVIEHEGKPTLKLDISDTGIGIAEEHKSIIWEEFRQVSEGHGRYYEGTGLGLTITRNFVQKLGGTISFESEPGEGSEFTVLLPGVITG